MSGMPRSSPYRMVPVPEALEVVLKQVPSTRSTEEIPISDALERVLAADITASTSVPPFPASIMDGYAVVSTDGTGVFDIVDDVTAGKDPTFSITTGQVAYITTGAVVPRGADAVVMVEETEGVVDAPTKVRIKTPVKSKENIRPEGCDIATGDVLLRAHHVIRPADIGLLASQGVTKIKVFALPRVAVLSTGDELAAPDSLELKGGQIRDSNRYMLLGLVKSSGGIGFDGGIVQDKEKELEERFLELLERADVLMCSGGVSMGSLDLIKPTLAKLGCETHFGRLNMKPGKPTTFATLELKGKTKLIFALPGNPVSALVCYHLLAEPAIKSMMGHTGKSVCLPRLQATLGMDVKMDAVRPEWHRGVLRSVAMGSGSQLLFYSTGVQASSRLCSVSGATVLAEVPSGKGLLARGTTVWVNVIGPLHDLNEPAPERKTEKKYTGFCRCDGPSDSTSTPAAKKQKFEDAGQRKVLRCAILTVSDTCAAGDQADRSGPECARFLEDPGNHSPRSVCRVVQRGIVPDDTEAIQRAVRQWREAGLQLHLIVTLGGTGFSARDITPEAIKPLLDRRAPGIEHSMIHHSLAHTPMAVLSRPVAGVMGSTVVISLPGNPKAVTEILTPLLPVIEHLLQKL